MNATAVDNEVAEGRRNDRVGLSGPVEYFGGPAEAGYARWVNLSQGGACVELGRYLRPGRRISLMAVRPRIHDEPAELAGRIVWCRPNADGTSFTAGVVFVSCDAVGSFAISSMVREAYKKLFHRLKTTGAADGCVDGFGNVQDFGNVQTAW